MSSKFKIQNSRLKIQDLRFGKYLFLFLFLILNLEFLISCSIPNLEPPECTASRGVVKEFYSYHFGNEMRFTQESLKPLEKFLTADYYRSLQNLKADGDVFTTNDLDYPKAFRTGGCEVLAPDKTSVEVLIFWKTDTRSEQRSIHAETVKQNGQWLINKIDN